VVVSDISDINCLLDLHFIKSQYDKSLLVNVSNLFVYFSHFVSLIYLHFFAMLLQYVFSAYRKLYQNFMSDNSYMQLFVICILSINRCSSYFVAMNFFQYDRRFALKNCQASC